jgi:4a-hydroxytetrahydrobiopterin dehydratase
MTLAEHHCRDGAAALDEASTVALLDQVPAWTIADGTLLRRYRFPNWQASLDFVNAISDMVEQQNHHPLLTMTFTSCELGFTTHSTGNALSLNDFICAARADAIYQTGLPGNTP